MNSAWKQRTGLLAAVLWWGSLTTVGFLVVPMLFAHLPTPADAGRMAAKLFAAQMWVSLACGLVVMMAARASTEGSPMGWADGALLFVFAGLLLALLVEFAVAPRIMARENLKVWHSVGSAMYFAQWVCAGVVMWKALRLSSRA
ncbi:DUF4149 domain-containing protein [Caenimonas sp. SL110]|uniref:DUF4149 domain-containing protein n=1 Tax=Caenimonas sp. SL110 TaxID=1450524 RepID=UPI000652AEDF|nr:DUF4149 domain-containing protein [Caenimonas sp. SL110]